MLGAIAFHIFLLATGEPLLNEAWPRSANAPLHEIGRGIAVVFSPDLSVPNNCRFYKALGFACFDDSDWTRVLSAIRTHNAVHPNRPIRTVVLETHGTNGHGLKLQNSTDPQAERSYISVGALQERLEPAGIRYVILSACNSGRLLRPSIYRHLDPNPGDKLFLPATCGIIGASPRSDPARSSVTILAPASSHVEMTVVGAIHELRPATRNAIMNAAAEAGIKLPPQFAVSDAMMQMISRDPALRLTRAVPVEELSRERTTAATSEALFAAFVGHLEKAASRGGNVTMRLHD